MFCWQAFGFLFCISRGGVLFSGVIKIVCKSVFLSGWFTGLGIFEFILRVSLRLALGDTLKIKLAVAEACHVFSLGLVAVECGVVDAGPAHVHSNRQETAVGGMGQLERWSAILKEVAIDTRPIIHQGHP